MRRRSGWALAAIAGVAAGCLQVIGYEDARPGYTGHGGSGGATSSSSGSGTTSTASTGTGGCSAGQTPCPSGCADLSSDSTNCGACAKDCEGGACQAGVCQPVPIATGQVMPLDIAVNDTSVFWINSESSVMRAPLAGGTPTMIAGGLTKAAFLALDATRVYWTTANDVESAPIGGTGATSVATVADYASGLVVDDAHVYWTTQIGVYSAPTGGGPPTQLKTASPEHDSLVVDATKLYWMDAVGLVAMPKGGGAVSTIVVATKSCPGGCSGPAALSGGEVFFQWLDGAVPSHWGIAKIPTGGGTPGYLGVAETGKIQSIVADGANVYASNGTLLRAPLAGGGPSTTLVASGVSKLAADATHLYWTSQSAGAVLRLAK